MNDANDEQLFQDDLSDDELDWEEVLIEQPQVLEIVITERPKGATEVKKRGISHAERILRIECHKLHTICLLVNARTRNRWLNDELLHARLLSLTPMPLQTTFAMITKTRFPQQAKRGRMFEAGLTNLARWWCSYFEVEPNGHLRSRTYDSVQNRMPDKDMELNEDALIDILDDEGEVIRTSKSLMKHALKHAGTRDTSAQLFTALCRGLGLPARLVVSLQSVPWKSGIGKPRPIEKRKKGKAPAEDESPAASSSTAVFIGEGQRLDGAPVEKSDKAKGKEKAKVAVKLRKAPKKGHVLGRKVTVEDDLEKTPPVFWTEVFSRPDGRWIPVDPLRAIVNKRNVFDPPPTSKQNRLLYVVAFEEDGYARDVTRKYAKQYASKIAKAQGGSAVGGGGKVRAEWWQRVVASLTRPYRLHRDDVEDEEMDSAQYREGMPTTLSGFKDHPLYVIPRHLRQTETLYPPPPDTPEVGTFRGEPVYPRSCVVSLKTAETWMRQEGRSVKEGVQPLKMIKQRTGTINKQREIELIKDGLRDAGEAIGLDSQVMQGLYARFQTEAYVPAPIIDGVIPRNDFGNIDLYVPSMLPHGGVHIPYKGTAKIAKRLGIDYAEAVTGFEFKKRRAFPMVEGVVIASENEHLLLDAYWESEQDALLRSKMKAREKAIKQWIRLITGLRVRQRLQDQYAKDLKTLASEEPVSVEQNPEPDAFHGGGGGFIIGADDVVSKFRLPNPQKIRMDVDAQDEVGPSRLHKEEVLGITYEIETMDIDPEEPLLALNVTGELVPKTMAELAEEAEQITGEMDADEEWEDLTSAKNGKVLLKQPVKKPKKGKPSGHTRAKRKRGKKDVDSDNGEEIAPSPTKRTKASPVKNIRAAPVVVASTRTLRPRKSKSVVDMAEEEAKSE